MTALPPYWREVPEDKPLGEVAREAFMACSLEGDAWEAAANAVAEVVATRLARRAYEDDHDNA